MSKSVVLNPLGMVDIAGRQVVMSRLVWDEVDVLWFVEEMEEWVRDIRERTTSLAGNHHVNDQA